MVAKENLHTVREFMDFVQRPENADKRFELLDGEIKEVSPSSKRNTALALRIGFLLGLYLDQNEIGILTGTDGGYKVTETAVFQPDIGFITNERMDGWDGVLFPVAPDLAVEVISPSEGPRDVVNKTQIYLQAGTKVVLAVYPEQRLIDVYRLNADGNVILSTLRGEADLTLDDVLPGFKVSLRKIFSLIDRIAPPTKRES
jgi:Uma2 family endonuclease